MAEPEAVILVHGLWVHGVVMALLERRIARHGYRVRSYSYPSLRCTLRENVERLARYCRGIVAQRLNFVAHSMGGLVVMEMLAAHREFATGRVVLMGTPYGGSFAARRLMRLPGGPALLGCCLPEWLGRATPPVLPQVEIAVLAGRVGIGLGRLIAPDMPKPNDGVVAVSETAVPGMRDHIVLDVNHTGMLLSGEVAAQVCTFLDRGTFVHG
ncbi:MAG TPA: alpha/beta fold hydrolase [Burkholderiales bacterium]|nr:alpha/beta fold hydrolase [Burkholderiales bacterium]